MFLRFLKIFMVIVLLMCVGLSSCSALRMRIKAMKKTGNTDLDQMRAAGFEFAEVLAEHLEKESCGIPSYVALLSPKIDAREKLPVAAFEDELVRFLLKKQIYVVRRENRGEELKKIHLSLGDSSERVPQSKLGNVKVPDYFVQISINERYYFKRNTKIQERTYKFDFRSIVTQKILFSRVVVAEIKIP